MVRLRLLSTILLCVLLLFPSPVSHAEFVFSDTRFQNDFSTENIDRIIEEYELYDGWYWTTQPDIQQNFHGHPECPG